MNVEHEQYKCVPGSNKYYFYINSDRLEEDIQWILANKIENIRLSQYDGYKLKTIEPIFRLKNIKSLVIFLQGVDLSKLSELHELEELAIGELNHNIDVSNLANLQDVYLLYHKNIKGLNTLRALRRLIVVKADTAFFSDRIFSFWGKLEDLTLLSPRIPSNLSFLRNLKSLKEFEINSSRSKFDASDLSFVKDSLEVLKIGSCKNIEGLETTLPKLVNLKWFTLTDSTTLKSTNFINYLPKLQTLIVLGSSYFEDGNLINLKGRLTHVSIDDKKHYNLKHKDFSQL
jgi:hypothetical protein